MEGGEYFCSQFTIFFKNPLFSKNEQRVYTASKQNRWKDVSYDTQYS